MRVAILSDIHGNLEAFSIVLKSISNVDNVILLGDNIDYCPHSNEAVSLIMQMQQKIICSIWGNHEKMILENDFSRFDLQRGVNCAMNTMRSLTDDTVNYLKNNLTASGKAEFEICGKRCLAVHGSLEDYYWGTIDTGSDFTGYMKYDYVFSGHSHIPHCFEMYYPYDDPKRRNKKKTIFVNPGSVGQPRNLSPLSQFAILDTDTEEIEFRKIAYDIEKEQSAFSDEVDSFYRERLAVGV